MLVQLLNAIFDLMRMGAKTAIQLPAAIQSLLQVKFMQAIEGGTLLQVRFQTNEQKDAERARSASRHAMGTTDTVRPIGVVSGTSVGGTRKPRTTTRALTDCIVTRADGTQYVIPRNTRKAATPRKRITATQLSDRAYNYVAPTTAANLAPILAD